MLVGSGLFVSLFRKYIANEVRITSYILIIATFVTLADLILAATFPEISKALGPFIPLIVANCLLLGRAEAFAAKVGPVRAVADGLGMGLGFTLALSAHERHPRAAGERVAARHRRPRPEVRAVGLHGDAAGRLPHARHPAPHQGVVHGPQRAARAEGDRMSNLAWIFFSTLLVNNFTLVMFLGLCSFFGVTAKIETAWRLGARQHVRAAHHGGQRVWFLNTYVLAKTPYLRTIAFIVVIASAVQIVEMAVKKYLPVLFRQLGIYLPLITTNCAILGLALFQTSRKYTLVEGIVFALGAGLGLTLALSLMASIRERIEVADVPEMASKMGLVLVVASCLSMAFMGFAGMGSG